MHALAREMLTEQLADCALNDKQNSHAAHHDGFGYTGLCVCTIEVACMWQMTIKMTLLQNLAYLMGAKYEPALLRRFCSDRWLCTLCSGLRSKNCAPKSSTALLSPIPATVSSQSVMRIKVKVHPAMTLCSGAWGPYTFRLR